jgi:CRP-like cAMP-binding protein
MAPALIRKQAMPAPLSNSLITKLTTSNHLNGDDIRSLITLPIQIRTFGAHQAIMREGDSPDACCLVGEGFAFRSKTSGDGERQILSLHIPGEIPDLQSLHLEVMDHDLTTLTSCTVGFISHAVLLKLNIDRPNIAAALWRETLIDASIFREWILNVGRREGVVRMAHLLCELQYRLEAISRSQDGTFELPISQSELGDCLGLSTVHANRVLKMLREEGLIQIERGIFHLLNRPGLEDRGDFDSRYLHLVRAHEQSRS